MKQSDMFAYLILTLALLTCSSLQAFAAADGYYVLSSTTTDMWDGTDANRQKPATADYVSTYGDESTVTYNLPASFGSFPFYGQTYTQITADTNGNIWFGSSGSAHSFNLASNGRGPVIAAWNNAPDSRALLFAHTPNSLPPTFYNSITKRFPSICYCLQNKNTSDGGFP